MKLFNTFSATSFYLLMAMLFWLVPTASASDVLVIAEETRGQGTLRKRGKECLIITPKHVVEVADEISLLLPDRSTAPAEILELYGVDLAILRPEAGVFKQCQDQPFGNEDLSDLLESNDRGTLKMRDSDGSAQLLQVAIEGYDSYKTIRILPSNNNQAIQQGFSGSLLYIDRKLVGMLTHVVNGIGVVMQAKTLNSVVDPFFQAANAGNSVTVATDVASEFLLPTISSSANLRSFRIVDDSEKWSYSIILSTLEETIDSETDKLLQVTTQLSVMDRFGNSSLSKELITIGNSFVDIEKARTNARKAMQTKFTQLDLFSKLN